MSDQKKIDRHIFFYPILFSIFIIFLTFLVYSDVIHHGFMEFLEDDRIGIIDNQIVKKGVTKEGVKWALVSTQGWNWFPFTRLSHMLDVSIFGLNPCGHHLTSVFFHILNSLLLWRALFLLTGSFYRSCLASLFFAIHPLHVESVVWISERKDLLSTFFFMLCLIFYSRYSRNPSVLKFLCILTFYSFGLMSKPMVVTLPFVLLLLDLWPLKRFNRDAESFNKRKTSENSTRQINILGLYRQLLIEKLPFFILSGFSIAITIFAQRGQIRSLDDFSLIARLANAAVSYAAYVVKAFWPFHLGIFYPHLGMPPVWKIIISFAVLMIISHAAFIYRKQSPHLLIGWLWFIGTLVPVIGIVQVGQAAMADRYTYIPYIGIFIMVFWSVPDVRRSGASLKFITTLIFSCIVFVMCMTTYKQVHFWRSDISLLNRTIEVTEANYVAHSNLGTAYHRKGKLENAISEYKKSLSIKPDQSTVHCNLGLAYAVSGNMEKAVFHLNESLAIDPDYAEAHFRLGNILLDKRDIHGAINHFKSCVRISPSRPEYRNNLGIAYIQAGQLPNAIKAFESILTAHPNHQGAINNLKMATRAYMKKN